MKSTASMISITLSALALAVHLPSNAQDHGVPNTQRASHSDLASAQQSAPGETDQENAADALLWYTHGKDERFNAVHATDHVIWAGWFREEEISAVRLKQLEEIEVPPGWFRVDDEADDIDARLIVETLPFEDERGEQRCLAVAQFVARKPEG